MPRPVGPDESVWSDWLVVTQHLIDQFGNATLDPDPMHVDPAWAAQHSPYGTTIAFGFQTLSLLTHLLHQAVGGSSDAPREHVAQGHFLNYGFDRLRLIAPVPVGSRIRAAFRTVSDREDERGRRLVTFDATVEIEGAARPALVATWLVIWVPAGA